MPKAKCRITGALSGQPWWLLHEIKTSHAKIEHLTFDLAARTMAWLLLFVLTLQPSGPPENIRVLALPFHPGFARTVPFWGYWAARARANQYLSTRVDPHPLRRVGQTLFEPSQALGIPTCFDKWGFTAHIGQVYGEL